MDGTSFVSPLPDFDALEAEITELWGHINAASFRFLTLVAAFDRAEGWARHGLTNCAQWLNWQCGIGTVAAREKVRIAHALASLPKISAAFAAGRISYSKVRAMTRVATHETEADLLNVALHGTAVHVERLVRTFRRVDRIEEARQAESQRRNRYVHCHYDDDGEFVLSARLPPEIGAPVERALEAAITALDEHVANETQSDDSAEASQHMCDDAETESLPRPARRADALRHLAETFLASETERHPSSAERFRVVVHVGAECLSRTHDSADTRLSGHCAIEDGPALARETARRLTCDCSVLGLLENSEGDVLDVGRRTRTVSAAMRRALKTRDGGCRFPGCDRARHTEGHHVQHWAGGGQTKLSNLVTLCRFHHRLIHEGGYGVRATDDGLFVFSRPDGTRIGEAGVVRTSRFHGSAAHEPERHTTAYARPAHDHGSAHETLFAQHASLGLMIDARTARTRWTGERMDYALAVEALFRQKHPAA